MSIHVTVSGNPIYYDRSKFLLTDIETAKKNEWLRRRKIRLQQARQQAKDHLYNVRKKVSSEESSIDKCEREIDAASQYQKKKEQIESLEQELEGCLSSVGSGHQLASLQAECDALVREKQELRDEIARARGAIAEEKMKAEKCSQKEKAASSVGRKQLARKVENLRSTLISNLPPARTQGTMSKKTVRVHVHRGADEDDLTSLPGQRGRERSPKRTLNKYKRNTSPTKSQGSLRKEGTQSDCDVPDSDDDSDVTWPPRSARVVKEPIPSPRVRFYDHSTRVAKEGPKPPYTVIPADPFSQPDMGEIIAEEEEAITRKENLDVLARREHLIRGSKALRKERDKKEADLLLKEIDEIEKRRKIQVAVSKAYPSKCHKRDSLHEQKQHLQDDDESEVGVVRKGEIPRNVSLPCTSREPMANVTNRERVTPGIQFVPSPSCQPGTEELLEDLIDKLKEERARKKKNLDNRFGVSGLEKSEIPLWIPLEEDQEEDDTNTSKWENILERSMDEERRRSFEGSGRRSPGRGPEQTTCPEVVDRSSPQKVNKHLNIPETRMRSPKREERYSPTQPAMVDDECLHCPERNVTGRTPDICDSRSPEENRRGTVKQKLQFTRKCSCNEKCGCSEDKVVSALGEGEFDSYKSRCETPVNNFQRENQRNSFEKEVLIPSKKTSQETISSSESSSQAETLRSCLTYEGVKVVVKVSDRNKKGKVCSPEKTKICSDKVIQTSVQESSSKSVSWSNDYNSNSSTSYRSLPSKISPESQILNSLLSRVGARSNNPRLQSYIMRLLGMTRESVDNLPVSSVSEVSIGSSVFEPSAAPCSGSNRVLANEQNNVSCQANNSIDDPYNEEVLKFSELAKGYANRVKDLAGMLEGMKILPCRETIQAQEDTTYMTLPEDIQVSVKISDSIKPGRYPRPLDISDIPTSIQPRPSYLPHQQANPLQRNGYQRRIPDDQQPTGLSTIQEMDCMLESGRVSSPKLFDSNVSSIKGTPEKEKGWDKEQHNSTESSLCLLDEGEMASSLFGSSSDDFEDVFRSLGIAWALPTVRRVRETRRRKGSSSSSSGEKAHYSHSTPLVRSPARGGSLSARTSPVKASFKPGGSSGTVGSRLPDSDSLTPPAYTLNIPSLAQYTSFSPRHS